MVAIKPASTTTIDGYKIEQQIKIFFSFSCTQETSFETINENDVNMIGFMILHAFMVMIVKFNQY